MLYNLFNYSLCDSLSLYWFIFDYTELRWLDYTMRCEMGFAQNYFSNYCFRTLYKINLFCTIFHPKQLKSMLTMWPNSDRWFGFPSIMFYGFSGKLWKTHFSLYCIKNWLVHMNHKCAHDYVAAAYLGEIYGFIGP